DYRNQVGCRLGRECAWSGRSSEHAHLMLDQIGEERRQPIVLPLCPTKLDCDVAALYVAGVVQALAKSADQVAESVGRAATNEPNHRYRRLLRPRCERPRRRAAEKRYELPPPHSITSSAMASSLSGIASPSAFAVARLMMSSNLVGCSTGIPLGF